MIRYELYRYDGALISEVDSKSVAVHIASLMNPIGYVIEVVYEKVHSKEVWPNVHD